MTTTKELLAGEIKESSLYAFPKVTVVTATEMDPVRAAGLLIFTKNTRLKMDAKGFESFIERCAEDPDWMHNELDYMSKTIRSSWEFLDIIFLIENVSRACAQQITRTRLASYAMQSQRVTDVSGSTFTEEDFEGNEFQQNEYEFAIQNAMSSYEELMKIGTPAQKARGVLPLNIHCNLVAKYNLRTLVDLIHARTSPRVQGEYREVAMQMRDQLVTMWPWAELFLRPANETAISLLSDLDSLLQEENPDLYQARMVAAKVRDTLK